jgi:hypothetical protein
VVSKVWNKTVPNIIYTYLECVNGTYASDFIYPAAAITAKNGGELSELQNGRETGKLLQPARTLSGYRDARYQLPCPPLE